MDNDTNMQAYLTEIGVLPPGPPYPPQAIERAAIKEMRRLRAGEPDRRQTLIIGALSGLVLGVCVTLLFGSI